MKKYKTRKAEIYLFTYLFAVYFTMVSEYFTIQHRTVGWYVNAIPLQAWTGPLGSRIWNHPEFLDNRHMKVVRLSALRTGRLYPPGNTAGHIAA
jgi:hypothetical protein